MFNKITMRILLLIIFGGVFLSAAEHTTAQQYGIPDSTIAAYPQPDVTPLFVDDSLLYDRIYRRVESTFLLYDAPNGNVAQNLGNGYSFVTLAGAGTQGAWTQVTADGWVQTSSLTENVAVSRFAGVRLPADGLPYTMAWTLRHLRAAQTPGGEASQANPFLYRYTRVNIYAIVEVGGYNWYQIGPGQWVHQFNVAKILPQARPAEVTTTKWISVDLYEQVLVAYEGETPVFATLISSGLPEWSTNEGTFNVWHRVERTIMSGAYNRPDFYYLQDVPYSMYFDGDIALHGTYWHDGFGYRQSHGCVNLSITDAYWVWNWSRDVRDFSQPESPDLSVHVFSSGTYN